jgi:WD40 repeat protein
MVDVEATVEATADARRLVVITSPGRERGLDVALVVDSSLVMSVFHGELAEFEALLRRAGAFRSVTRWTLVPNQPHHQAGQAADPGPDVMIRDSAGVEHHTDRLLDPSGRRLVLLATDAVADHWYRDGVWQAIRRWAQVMPMAVIDVLPEQYRAQTALGMSAAVVRSRRPAGPNAAADVQVAWWEADLHPEGGLPTAVPLPVVSLRRQALEIWAEAIAAAGTAWVDAVWVQRPPGSSPSEANANLTAEDRVQAFLARASRDAQALARIVAMAPVLTLPLIRVLQAGLLPGTGSSELAEVLVGGLIERVPGQADRNGPGRFRFRPAIRELLLRGRTATQEWDTHKVITQYLKQDARTGGDIHALLANPRGSAEVDVELEPFAALGHEVASRLGLQIGNDGEASATEEPETSPSEREYPPETEYDGDEDRRFQQPSDSASPAAQASDDAYDARRSSPAEEHAGPDRYRVCEVYGAGPDGEGSGSGYRIGDRLVLTARYAIAPALAGTSGRVLVRPVGVPGWLPARVEWADADTDAALAVIEDDGWQAPAGESVLRWGELTGSDPVPCAAVGFPWASARPDRMRDTAHVYGQLAPLGQLRQGRLDLDVVSASESAQPGGSPWAGMSGAGVISDSHLVGVIIVDPARHQDRLVAVPVGRLLADESFRACLAAYGVHAEASPVGIGPDPDARPGRRWDVALSFAGAQRDYVEQVAQALQARGLRCFYDDDEQIELWGKYLAEELPVIYGEQAAAVVVFMSAEYAARDWTRLERRVALNRAVQERREYVLPAQFDDTPLPGLMSDIAAVDLRGRSPQQFAAMIAAKLATLGIVASVPLTDARYPPSLPESLQAAPAPPTPAGSLRIFEVEIGPGDAPGMFRVEVVASPAGEGSATVELDTDALMARRGLLQQAVLASAVPRRWVLPETEQPVREIGQVLFATLLGTGEVAGLYRASAAVAAEYGQALRLVLRIDIPELAGLPWEAMYDQTAGEYVCRHDQLVRRVPVASVRVPLRVQPPLRILGVVSSPRGLPALDVQKEQNQLARALAQPASQGLAEVHWATGATWEDLQEVLLDREWHVLHFIGHGDFDPARDEGVLALVRKDGRADLVAAHRLVDLLRQARPMPPLVVLNSCPGAATGVNDLFSGTAAALVRGGVSAVAAMQYEISDPAAVAFARGFYAAIVRGRSVEDAVSSGRVAILGLSDGTLEWLTPVLYLRGHDTRLITLAATAEDRDREGIGSIRGGQHLARTLTGHTNGVYNVAFSPDGRLLATASLDRTARVWDPATGDCLRTLTGHTNTVWAVAFSPDGRLLATASPDMTARVWDPATGDCLRTLTGHTDGVTFVTFSPDGRLATASDDRTARVWDPATGDCLRTLTGHTSKVYGVAFSPDGRLLATASDDGTARVWDMAADEDRDREGIGSIHGGQHLARTLTGHTNVVWAVAFSPDGWLLATGSDDGTARVWDMATGDCLRTLTGHTNTVWAVAFSPDGRLLATASVDTTARLWDPATGDCLGTLTGHTSEVTGVAFSPDGRLLATGSNDKTARLWD